MEALGQRLQQAGIHVCAAELGVAAGGLDFEHALAEFHDGHVQGAAAEVYHRNPEFLACPVQPVGQRGGGGFVHQAHHLQAGNLAGVLGGRALVIVEVSGHGDHCLRDRLAKKGFGVALDLLQQEGGQLLRRELLVAQPNRLALTHLALECGGGAFRVGDRLAPRRLADDHLPVGRHRHIAGEGLAAQAHALGAGDDDRTPAAQHSGGGIGGAEINTDDGHHTPLSSCLNPDAKQKKSCATTGSLNPHPAHDHCCCRREPRFSWHRHGAARPGR